ncbi:DoxX family protein [Niabella drilacis]|uniref:DoxX-like family protein n=1 Tax=Niabella drilacis (strain DSM 25811 / CCM 8410 / CCUG 62505 / LMG 26954 / E90) TaxID=1285928 RepID=A0A1G6SC93_NIADE|nr:DoxX family protein [Niabella drilacis]SDD14353.1 DoxX-like family protein [Niabella drilacis]
MKKTKILYWTFTGLIVLLDGVMPALTSHTELAKQGISHLGYPDYFRVLLTVFKVTGALLLALPFVKGRIKEWAYAGFTFNFISAAISHTVVDGFGGQTLFPVIMLGLLAASYHYYHKLSRMATGQATREKLLYSVG